MAKKREIILDIRVRKADAQKQLEQVNTDLGKQRLALAELNKAFRASGGTLANYGKDSVKLRGSINALSAEQRVLDRTVKNADIAFKAQAGSMDQLKARLSVLTAAYNKLQKEERETSEEGRTLSVEIRNITDTLKEQESAIGNSRRNVGNYGSAFQGLKAQVASTVSQLVGPLSFAFAVREVADVVKSSVKVFVDFDNIMNKLEATTQGTKEEMVLLEADARALGGTTEFTAAQVGELQLAFAKLGFSTDEILNATAATLDLATATGEDLARSAEVAGATLRAFGLPAEETQRVVDVMAQSFSSSALNLEKFATAMATVGPVANAFNFEVEDTTALLGTLVDAGFDASSAGTALRNIFLNLADPAGDLSQSLGRNITSLDDLIPAFIELRESGIDLAGALELTDKRSVAAFNQFLQGAEKTGQLSEKLNEASGAAARMAGVIRDSLQGDMDTLNSAISEQQIKLGEELAPALRSTIQFFTELIVRAGEMGKEFRGVTEGFRVLKVAVDTIAAPFRAFDSLLISIGERLGFASKEADAAGNTFSFVGELVKNAFGLKLIESIGNTSLKFRQLFNLIKSFSNDLLGTEFELDVDVLSPTQKLNELAKEVEKFELPEPVPPDLRLAKESIKALSDEEIKEAARAAAGRAKINQEAQAQALKDQLVAIELRLIDARAGSKEELELRKQAIDQQTQIEIAGARRSAAEILLIRRQAEQEKNRLQTEFNARLLIDSQKGLEGLRAGLMNQQAARSLADHQQIVDKKATEGIIIESEREAQRTIQSLLAETFELRRQLGAASTEAERVEILARIHANEQAAERLKQIAIEERNALGDPAERLNAFLKGSSALFGAFSQAAQRTVSVEEQVARKQKELGQATTDAQREQISQQIAALREGGEAKREETIVSQGLAVAEATINTYLSVVQALKNPPGPPFTIPFAVAAGIFGLGQVAKISGISFAEGGGTGTEGVLDPQIPGRKITGYVHDNEYVIPKKVLKHPEGAGLVLQAERLRRQLPGFAVGGFTSAVSDVGVRSNITNVQNSFDIGQTVLDAVRNIQPIVSVKDIATVQNRVNVKENFGKL